MYTNPDVIGVELGGSLKNVIAIASGFAHSMDLGDNCMGTLLTRGMAEIVRLSVKRWVLILLHFTDFQVWEI